MSKQQVIDKVNNEMMPLNAVSTQKTAEIILDVVNLSDEKVDKIPGYGLSQQNYTTSEKNKLANLSEHFKGYFIDVASLESAFPVGADGDYAFVDQGVGEDSKMYIWDKNDTSWVLSSGGGIIPDATETLSGIIEIATIAEALERTDDARAMTALKTIALILDEKKSAFYHHNPYGLREVSYFMLASGNIIDIYTAGLNSPKLKIGPDGVYPLGDQVLPFAYSAGDQVFVTYNYNDQLKTSGNIIIKCKDN